MSGRVSVVVPCYNGAKYLDESLSNVVAQTRPAHEVFVVDDGSTDGSAEVAATYPATVLRQANAGPSAARNLAVAQATGEYVAFLDADDVWHPRKLELQVAVLDANPQLGLVGVGVLDYPCDLAGVALPATAPPLVPVSYEQLLVGNRFTPSAVMVRRETLLAAGGFDPAIRCLEDWDCFLRVARIAGVATLPLPLTGYRVDAPGSASKRAANMIAGMGQVHAKLRREGAWRGRPLTRLRSVANHHGFCAYLLARHGHHGDRLRGSWHAVRSLVYFPGPLGVGADLRVRLLAGHLANLVRRK